MLLVDTVRGQDRRRRGDQGPDRAAEALPRLGQPASRLARRAPGARSTFRSPTTRRSASSSRLSATRSKSCKMVLLPMVINGEEPTSSMGNDTPLAVLSDRPQLLVQIFPPALRPGHEPADRSDPRAAGHVARDEHRPPAQSPGRSSPRTGGGSRSSSRSSPTRSSTKIREIADPYLQDQNDPHALSRRRRPARASGRAAGPLPPGLARRARGLQVHHPERSRGGRDLGADPEPARGLGGPPSSGRANPSAPKSA